MSLDQSSGEASMPIRRLESNVKTLTAELEQRDGDLAEVA
jgi:hypothetical protein